MTVSPEQRSRYHHVWRRLASEARDLAQASAPADPRFRGYALEAGKWIAPSERAAETAVCGALGPMAYAYARADTAARRAALAPSLIAWAEAVLAILAAPPDPAPSVARSLPFRADLDG